MVRPSKCFAIEEITQEKNIAFPVLKKIINTGEGKVNLTLLYS